MDYQPYNPYTDRSAPASNRPNGDTLATAAMILGIVAVVLCATFTLYPTFVLGSIGIVLALLSKGKQPRPAVKARIGMACALTGILINCALIATTYHAIRTDPQVLEKANQLIEEQYGMTYEEIIDAILNGEEIPYPQGFYQ